MLSDVVILTHGAAAGNIAFMSPDAVVIEHGFRPDDHKLHELSLQLLVDLSVPAFFIGVSPTGMDAAIPKQHHFLKQTEFLALPADARLEIVVHKKCTPRFTGPCDYWKHFTL